jgi:integrase
MVLKLKRRKDISNNNYYIRGTFNYRGKSCYVNNKSTLETSYNKAKIFLEYYEEVLTDYLSGKCDIYGNKLLDHEKATFKDGAKLKKKDTFKPLSAQSRKLVDNLCEFIIDKQTNKTFGDVLINDISNKEIQDLAFKMYPMSKEWTESSYTDLSEEERLQKSSRLNTMNRNVISPISVVLHYGASQKPKLCDYMVINRFKILKRPPIYFTYQEFNRIIESPCMFQIKLLCIFLVYTGARLQEALNCKWSDIENNKIFLWQSKQDDGRFCQIHPFLEEWLNQVKDKGIYIFQWRKGWANKKDGEGLYFNWRDMLRNADVDLKKLPHKCRHTFGTWLRKAGCSLDDIKEIGGWKDDKSVRIYSHIMPDTKKTQIMKLPHKVMALPNNIIKIESENEGRVK